MLGRDLMRDVVRLMVQDFKPCGVAGAMVIVVGPDEKTKGQRFEVGTEVPIEYRTMLVKTLRSMADRLEAGGGEYEPDNPEGLN